MYRQETHANAAKVCSESTQTDRESQSRRFRTLTQLRLDFWKQQVEACRDQVRETYRPTLDAELAEEGGRGRRMRSMEELTREFEQQRQQASKAPARHESREKSLDNCSSTASGSFAPSEESTPRGEAQGRKS
mmetsp:Transcript_130568/g.226958  ORF Transcript_130568/g.226958 Transcript_130568/m.226958 type:complete len:133 (+) Transcript_130568:111-509(+)